MKDGKPVSVVGQSDGRTFRGHVRRDMKIGVSPGPNMITQIDARSIKPVAEETNDIPIEVEPPAPLSLQDSIKQFCAQMVQHEFGRDSAEVDAFEEAFDFDIPDDDDFMPVGSAEVQEMVPDLGPEGANDENAAVGVESQVSPEGDRGDTGETGQTEGQC